MNAIKDILHDEKYKGVTGLVDVLNQYIEEQFTKAEEEDTKISAEEKDVVDERTVRKMRVERRVSNDLNPGIYAPSGHKAEGR